MLRRWFQLGIALCLTFSASLAAYERGQTRVNLGYRQDDFSWSIAGPEGIPNILSELKWQKLHMLEANLFGWHSSSCIPYLRWAAAYSAIMRGKVIDRDFAANNKQLEFSRAVASCNQGTTLDLSGAIGWPFAYEWKFWCCSGFFQIAPVVGLSWHQQHLHMHGGCQQLLLYRPEELGRIHGLHSEYRTHWWGPWAGVDAVVECGPRLTFTGAWEYHWNTRYHARGDWNLRKDFCGGFHHYAYGHGWIARCGGEFAFDCNWLFSLDGTIQRWNTRHGQDRTSLEYTVYSEDDRPLGIDHYTVHTPFNGAHWDSFSITMGVAYRY